MPLELNGYSAHVNCDGKELETYDVRMEDERTISCWIRSEEGKVVSSLLCISGASRRWLARPHAESRF